MNKKISPPLRYIQLGQMVQFYQPNTILEVGTWNGKHGAELSRIALKSHKGYVNYTGYDLFQEGNFGTDSVEFNSKSRTSVEEVREIFDALTMEFPHRFTYKLIKGDTNITMKEHKEDFVFLDGGHSPETARNDYEKSKESKVIVFDDYFSEDKDSKIPHVNHQGTNLVVDSLRDKAKWIFPSMDQVAGGGITHLAVIVNEGKAPPNKDVLLMPIFIE